MDDTSSFGRPEEKSSSPADLRQDARFRVENPEAYRVSMTVGHTTLECVCVDYSPFGLGVRLQLVPNLPLLSIGESIDLVCNFSGSKFSARGTIANSRVETTAAGDFVRIGIALSRSAEVVRPSHVKRRSARIQMSEGVAPLVSASDELRFGDTIFGKMTDISQGGMRLLIDRHPLPFMEKQRHWFDIVLPVFGRCRAYCRIAYVRRDEEGHRYIVGCEFIDGGEEQELRPVEDWLFFGHLWLSRSDILSAGFRLPHIDLADEKFRVLISGSESFLGAATLSSNQHSTQLPSEQGEPIDFSLAEGSIACRVNALFYSEQGRLSIQSADAMGEGAQPRTVQHVLWKSLLVYALHNRIRSIDFSEAMRAHPLVKDCLSVTRSDGPVHCDIEAILAADTLKFSLWRKLYSELRRKGDFNLSAPKSFVRRLSVY